MSTLKQLFPNQVVLALDRRLDTHTLPLRKHLKKRFDIDLHIFLAGDGSIRSWDYDHIDVKESAPRLPGSSGYPTWQRPAAYNTFLCHQKMIARAKAAGWEHILMLEDDMFYEVQTEAVLAQLATQIKSCNWDLLYVGFCAPPHRTDINDPNLAPALVPAGQCCGGFHCVAIKHTVYDVLLNFQPLGCMDAMCDSLPNRWVIVPKLGEQKPGYSYVEQTVFSREDCDLKLQKLRKIWPDV